MNWVIQILLSFAIFCIVLGIDHETDMKLWKQTPKVHPKHTKGFWIRIAGLAPAIYFLQDLLKYHWTANTLIAIGFYGFLWILIFDGWCNVSKGQRIFYAGSKDGNGNDAFLDLWFMKIGEFWTMAFKIFGLFLFATLLRLALP